MVKKLGEVGGFLLIAWVALMCAPQLFVSSWIFEDGQLVRWDEGSGEVAASDGRYQPRGAAVLAEARSFVTFMEMPTPAGGDWTDGGSK